MDSAFICNVSRINPSFHTSCRCFFATGICLPRVDAFGPGIFLPTFTPRAYRFRHHSCRRSFQVYHICTLSRFLPLYPARYVIRTPRGISLPVVCHGTHHSNLVMIPVRCAHAQRHLVRGDRSSQPAGFFSTLLRRLLYLFIIL